MNDRIRELANKAIKQPDTDNDGLTVFDNDELAKFAELIVRDIIGIVEGYCETSPEIYGLPLEILEHFDMELTKE